MLPNEQLSNALLTMSSRQIADNFDIGRTTVNKHRSKCMGSPVIARATEQPATENQSLEWSGTKGVWNTGLLDSELSDISHEAILAKFGHDPERVAIRGVLRESHKEYWSRDLEKMLWKHSYSFAVEKKSNIESIEDLDAVDYINKLSSSSKRQVPPAGGLESTFCIDWADWQYAKMEMGGTKGLIERVHHAIEEAVVRIEELRLTGRDIKDLVIFGGGDMVEGCTIYPNQSFEIDGHRREQVRGTAALITHGIMRLAPLFETVKVVVVPGNHGENRINGNRTAIGDNDDLLVFEIAEMAVKHHPDMGHVSFEIAEKEISMITKIYDWTYGLTHGDVYGKSGGTGVRNKVFNWFRTMAGNRHPVGQSDVLLTHHFHHDCMEDWGATLWIQNPTMDGGSHYYKEATGHDTKPGMNSWVVTRAERFQDKQLLR